MPATLSPALFDEVEEALKNVMDPELADALEEHGYDRFVTAAAAS